MITLSLKEEGMQGIKAAIKYFRKMGSRAEPQERSVMSDHLSEIMDTAADRYDSYCKARGYKKY